MSRWALICAVATTIGLLTLHSTASAQGGSASVVAVSADHELLGSRLIGGQLSVRIPSFDERFAFRFGAEHLWGSAERTGIPCEGLIQPRTCAPERLRDDARFSDGTAGAELRVLSGWHIALALTGDLCVASVRVDTHGLTSGALLSADKMLWGGLVGAEAEWFPVSRLPLALEAELAFGGLTPIQQDQVEDGYSPFEGGFSLKRLRVGVAWRAQPR